jgi:hypothetical protein
MLRIAGAFLGLFLCATVPAQATTLDYAFSFTSLTGFSGSGNILVNSAVDSLGGHDITGINGSILGPASGAIKSLDTQPGTPNATGLYTDPVTGNQWLYNDVLFTSGVPFDNNGVLFSFGNKIVGNIYSVGTQLYLSLSQPSADYNPGVAIKLTVSQTPLPPALPMFITALGGLFLVLRRRNKATGLELDQLAAT